MPSLLKSLTLSFIALAGVSAASSLAKADEGGERAPRCTNATLRGQYSYAAKGVTLPNGPLPAPLFGAFASGGISVFDGKGRFTLTATSSFNGVIQAQTVGGSYQVNEDCTYTSRADNGITFTAVVSENARTLYILQTTPGTAIVGTAEKLDGSRKGSEKDSKESEDTSRDRKPQACSVDLTHRRYGFIAEGMAGAPTLPGAPFGPLVGVGTVKFDNAGRFALAAQRSVNGAVDPQVVPLAGAYTVQADCSVDMKFDVGFNFHGGAAGQGETVQLVQTDPGTAILVRATAQ
jgi:hypothetical protein